MSVKVFVIFVAFFRCLLPSDTLSDPNQIPERLVECYRNPVQLMPMSIRTFIDLMRKVESDPRITMELRMMTNAILSRFWRDGIVRDPNVASVPHVLPFTGAGRQFYKYNLLRNLIPFMGGPSFPDDSLTLNERCTLHFMLSSSMEVWERGDEFTVCPGGDYQRQVTTVQMTGNKKSACPIELGVVLSDFGTISLNHVLLGIATSLQRMEVNQELLMEGVGQRRINMKTLFPNNKTIDNFWASTVAGDLAEMVVFQLPTSGTPKFGPGGFWNDSVLPVFYYQITNYDGVLYDYWEDTNAEILGGIDGVMIGTQVLDWTSTTWTLRLSQVMEMFYSKRGGLFPNQQRACDRREFFAGKLSKNRGVLQQQTLNFAELLAARSTSVLMDNAFIAKNTPEIFNVYKDYTASLVEKYPSCPSVVQNSDQKVRLNVIFDATWDPYATLQILMKISIIADVSKFGSTITVINGANGDVVVLRARTSGDLYINWLMSSDYSKDVKKSDITEGILSLKRIVESDDFRKSRNEPAADVTLVLGKTSLLTDTAIERITSTLKAIKSEIPEMRFMYAVSSEDSGTWSTLTELLYSQNDKIITYDGGDLENLFTKLEILRSLPQSILPPLCSQLAYNEVYSLIVEEYVTPGVPKSYIIHPTTFCSSSSIDISVENFQHGDLMICMTSVPIETAKNPECQSLGRFKKLGFHVRDPCPSKNARGNRGDWDKNCLPIYIRVVVLKSTSSCTEKNCRFVDQVRFNFNIQGISCRKSYSTTCSATSYMQNTLVTLFSMCFLASHMFKYILP